MKMCVPVVCVGGGLNRSIAELNGLSFQDLSKERQCAYMKFSLTYTLLPKDTPKEDVFDVYCDINCGGEDITFQQVTRARERRVRIRI